MMICARGTALSTQRVDYGHCRTLKGLWKDTALMGNHQERWIVCDFGQTNYAASAEVRLTNCKVR